MTTKEYIGPYDTCANAETALAEALACGFVWPSQCPVIVRAGDGHYDIVITVWQTGRE
jgi:hypothetical protein